jgi:hypothetical protein
MSRVKSGKRGATYPYEGGCQREYRIDGHAQQVKVLAAIDVGESTSNE